MPRHGPRTLIAGALLAVLACVLVLQLTRTRSEPIAPPQAASAPLAAGGEPLDAPTPVARTDAQPATERVALEPSAAEDERDEREPQPVPFRPLDLYGRVVAALDEAPIAGARGVVTAEYPRADEPVEPLGRLVTDARGRFRLAELGRRKAAILTIEADGFQPLTYRALTGRDEDLRLQRARTIAGRVLRRDDRSAVPGTRVRLLGVGLLWNGQRFEELAAVCDASGAFRLEGAREDLDAFLWVQPPGGLERRHQVSVGNLDQELTLYVEDQIEVALRLVTLEGGIPLAGARGTIERHGPFEADGAGVVRLRVETAAFAEADPPGVLKLAVDPHGHCRSTILLDSRSLGVEPRDLPVTRGWSLDGRVRDARGEPVAGARVWQVTGTCRNLESPEDAFPGLPAGVVIDRPPFDVTPKPTVSDADGAFLLERAFTSCLSSVTFGVLAEGFAPLYVDVEVPPAATTARLDVTLEPWRAALEGRVLRDGQPLRCRVTSRQASGRFSGGNSCETNDGGEYALERLQPGAVTLDVSVGEDHGVARDWVSLHTEELVLSPGRTRHDLTFEEERLAITGIVRDPEGGPVADALVFPRVDGGFWTDGIDGVGAVQTRSDQDGRFRLMVQSAAEPYELVAHAHGATTSERAVAGDEGVELVLPWWGALRLDVRAAETDEVVPLLALVEGWSSSAPRGSPGLWAFRSHADERGQHRFELACGSWDLLVHAVGYAPTWLRAAPITGDGPVLRLVLSLGRTLHVRYRDAPEDLRPHAPYVLLEEELERRESDDPGTTFAAVELGRRLPTDPLGGSIPHLGPGRYVLHGYSRAWRVEPQRFEIDPGADTTLTFRWVPAEAR